MKKLKKRIAYRLYQKIKNMRRIRSKKRVNNYQSTIEMTKVVTKVHSRQ